jgi:hypothetical protein
MAILSVADEIIAPRVGTQKVLIVERVIGESSALNTQRKIS